MMNGRPRVCRRTAERPRWWRRRTTGRDTVAEQRATTRAAERLKMAHLGSMDRFKALRKMTTRA
jgi:hypothetical protein